MLIVNLASFLTGVLMLVLSVVDLRADFRKPRWKLRHSLDVILYAVGFVCVILTSLYAFFTGVVCI